MVVASGGDVRVELVAFVVAVLAGLAAIRSWRRKWEVDDTPTSTCRGVFVGRNEVVGRAVPTGPVLRSPFSGSETVWFEWHLERYRKGKNGGTWHTIEKRSTAAPFWLEDDTGRVLVRPRSSDVEPEQTVQRELGPAFAPPYSRWQLRQWVLAGEDVAERHRSLTDPAFLEPPQEGGWFTTGTAEPVHALPGRLRITEKVLRAGTPLYVLGEARARDDGAGIELVQQADRLLITTRTEEQVAGSERTTAALGGVASLVASGVFAGALSAHIHDRIVWAWPLLLVGVELGVLFLFTLTRNYNRQVLVKQQAAKAWSMIDVSLRRRADLLPMLATVAEAAAAHERTVQAAGAELRADRGVPTAEELPGDATLAAAEAADRAQRAAAAGAFALREAHPSLLTSESFLDLQNRIVDAEEAVASARTFYNDAINVLRDRRQTFPGSLFARLVDVPSWRLFEAEEAARPGPQVVLAPAAADADPDAGPSGPADGPPPQPAALPPPPDDRPPSGETGPAPGAHLPPPPRRRGRRDRPPAIGPDPDPGPPGAGAGPGPGPTPGPGSAF